MYINDVIDFTDDLKYSDYNVLNQYLMQNHRWTLCVNTNPLASGTIAQLARALTI